MQNWRLSYREGKAVQRPDHTHDDKLMQQRSSTACKYNTLSTLSSNYSMIWKFVLILAKLKAKKGSRNSTRCLHSNYSDAFSVQQV